MEKAETSQFGSYGGDEKWEVGMDVGTIPTGWRIVERWNSPDGHQLLWGRTITWDARTKQLVTKCDANPPPPRQRYP